MSITSKQKNNHEKPVAGLRESSGSLRSLQSSDTTLSGYFKRIGHQKTLDAAEELAQAKNLFELEQALWVEILSERSGIESLNAAIENHSSSGNQPDALGELKPNLQSLSRSIKKSSASLSDAVKERIQAAAEALQTIDEDRSLVTGVLEALKKPPRSASAQEGRLATIRRIAGSVTRAKHLFIKENLGLVVNIAKRFHVDQMSLSDLIQEGNLGLMRAVDKFDYRKGFRFSTYASWWIRSYISRAIVRKSNTVRIPEYMLRDRNRIKRTEEAHKARLGRSLNEEELASELGLSKKRLRRTLRHDVAFVESLDREMPGNDNQKYIDFLADEETKSPLEMASLNDWLKSIPKTLEHLSVVERFVICWRFGLVDGDEMTLQEIGQCLSLSRERIRQIQEEALVKLRDKMEVTAA
jgi:RNA polymerase primary sigma factor